MSWKLSKPFYGWWIVGASFFIALYVGGIVCYGFTALFEPIANEMGWSYTQVSLAASMRGLEAGLLAPIIGMFADRWSSRMLIFSGLVIVATGLILLGSTTSLGMFYGAFALIAIGMSASTVTVPMTAIANWFRRKVGIASGIASCGFGFGGLLIPVIVRLVDLYEWRVTVIILGLGVVMVLPLSLVFRHKPEQYNHFYNGQVEDLATCGNGSGLSQAVEADLKSKQALKRGVFWHLALAFMYNTLVMNAVMTHVMPYLNSIGISRSISSLVATTTAMMSIGGRLGLGWFGDRFDRRLALTGTFAIMGCGLLCFGYTTATSAWLLVPFVVLFGIGYGGVNALRPSLVREYFGRTNFGSIFGLIIGIGALGGIIGPTLAGWAYDNWGSYHDIWFVYAGLAVLTLILVLTITPITQIADRGN